MTCLSRNAAVCDLHFGHAMVPEEADNHHYIKIIHKASGVVVDLVDPHKCKKTQYDSDLCQLSTGLSLQGEYEFELKKNFI